MAYTLKQAADLSVFNPKLKFYTDPKCDDKYEWYYVGYLNDRITLFNDSYKFGDLRFDIEGSTVKLYLPQTKLPRNYKGAKENLC